MRAALASRNPGKLRELRALLPGWEIEPLDTAGIAEETGATFYENARAKALFARARAAPADWALGEDSGLEVDGLGGAPGVRSARYAGAGARDEENLARLLAETARLEADDRGGRYVCELVLVSPSGEEYRGRGTLEGVIAREARGSGGFGYDPIFVPLGEQRTVAELGDAWKAHASHRAVAARALLEALAASRPTRQPGARAGNGPVGGPGVSPPSASVPAVEAAEALADLIEISTQIRLAVLVDDKGEPVASAGIGTGEAGAIAGLARQLLSGAEEAMGDEAREQLVQLQAALPDGCVFLVQDEGRLVVAVTVPEPTVGLVFYDLKTCLRHVAGESLAPKPKAREGSQKVEDAES